MKYLQWLGYLIMSVAVLSVSGGILVAILSFSAIVAAVVGVFAILSFLFYAIKDHFETKPEVVRRRD